MSINRYFQDEMIALREIGREFAARKTALAPFLNTPGKDPDVERILEGFAFLTGRLRQKLDDDLPEIIQALFNLLWPNYLRPIPAASIIQYEPTENISGVVPISRGTTVESIPVQGLQCKFQTVYDTEILPMKLVNQTFVEKDGEPSLVLGFETLDIPLGNLPFSKLRLFLTGEPRIAQTIYFTMTTRVEEVRVVLRDSDMKPHIVGRFRPVDSIRPVGFREDEGLYPYPANTFPGYRILQEYCCFPEKFSFVEVDSLDEALSKDTLARFPNVSGFELHFALFELPESFESFRPDNWRLYCTPVVNLFPMDASPLTHDYRQTEYRIVPDPRHPYHYTTYSVDKVQTWGSDARFRKQYTQFESFEHEAQTGGAGAYYRLRIRPSQQDSAPETYISLTIAADQDIPISETISLELTCTNRDLPRELAVGDIRIYADNTPDTVTFSNITPVIPAFNPPLDGDLLWRLLSNMSTNYIPLTNIPALRAIITAYDFRAHYDRPRARVLEKTLKGMVAITCQETDRIYKGLPLRGARTTLVLDQRAFNCEGDLYMFGSVLNEFFALYATTNSFHQFLVVEEKKGAEYAWPVRLGTTRI